MGKTEKKRKLLEACNKAHKKTIDNIREAMDEAQKSADEYGQQHDIYDSYRTQLYRKRDMFAQQLQKALDQLEIFNKIDPDKIKDTVEFGSVVYTNTQKVFISTSIGKVSLDGESIYTISPMVPFFHAMKDLKKGDEFEFRGNKIKIKDIY